MANTNASPRDKSIILKESIFVLQLFSFCLGLSDFYP